jgi:glycosyltransferase involved in cell wall biosynthesis
MACGTPVIASDIPALREVGGDAALFCPVGDTARWSETVLQVLAEGSSARCAKLIRNAGRFSWNNYATQMLEVYRKVMAQ